MRSRNIKPGFFENEDLAEIHWTGRIIFQALWCLADREGRLEDRPKRIAKKALPYDDADGEAMLQALHDRGFIVRYEVDGCNYIQVLNFLKHQSPHHNESPSEIPAPEGYEPTPKRPYKKKSAATGQEPKEDGTSTDQEQDLSEKRPVQVPVMEGTTSDHGENISIHGKNISIHGEKYFPPFRPDSLIPLFSDSLIALKDLNHHVLADARTTPTITENPTIDPFAGISEHDRLILQTLKGVQAFPFDFKKDLAYIHNMQVEFPDINVLTVAKRWATAKLDKPLVKKSNPRAQFRKWCENESDWGKEKANGQTGQSQGLAGSDRTDRANAGGIPSEEGYYRGIGRRMPNV